MKHCHFLLHQLLSLAEGSIASPSHVSLVRWYYTSNLELMVEYNENNQVPVGPEKLE